MTLNPDYIQQRKHRESIRAQKLSNSGDPIRRFAESCLKYSGLRTIARKKALALQLEHNNLFIKDLTPALNGYRILHISDPHYPEQYDHLLAQGIETLTTATDHDLAVLTGDYRDRSFGPYKQALNALKSLRPHLSKRAIAILGNHDPIDLVQPMQDLGYEVLVNQTVLVEHDGAGFDLLGVDDPSDYGMQDLQACLADCQTPHQVLLAHSPDLWSSAVSAGIDAYLCGHTHGGQLCLPGGYPVRRNVKAPLKMISGSWQQGQMSGYTSRGAGTSIIDARSFCPPELTLHSLSGC